MKKIDFTNIKKAYINLSLSTELERNYFLKHLAEVLWNRKEEIAIANQRDLEAATGRKLSKSFIERLILDEAGISKIIQRLKNMQKLNANLGEVIEQRILKNKVKLKKIRTSIGVIAVIYESRPEVTIDVAALCIKSGNVAILKGGSEALLTNKSLYSCVREALEISSINTSAISFVTTRGEVSQLLKKSEHIDLAIARGSYDLVKAVMAQSKVPVLAHSAGGARIYVDKSADLEMAEKIIINAKTSKSSACNSVDTILVHKDLSKTFLRDLIAKLQSLNIKILRNDWDTEFLELTLSIKIISNVDEAIEFINKHSKKHSEGIIAEDENAIVKFTSLVDSAAVFINCSTRLHDGYEFGLGSEMGISTGKLHARGPVGLKELTTYKWEAYGNGQIRG